MPAKSIRWPDNVERIEHLPPADHPAFYAASRFALNVTRADMIAAGWSPSVRLFEAAGGEHVERARLLGQIGRRDVRQIDHRDAEPGQPAPRDLAPDNA